MKVLGVIMAGGRNTRYGSPKAFAEVGGARIIDRVVAALRSATDDVVMIANDAATYGSLQLPMRADAVPDAGPLGGLLTALRWAEELRADGIIAVACDMPFPSSALLATLVGAASGSMADVVAPESGSRRGIEPLFAFYSTRCIAPVERAIDANDHRMIAFHDAVRVVRIPIDQVREFGDPAVLFMNVNTPDELLEAKRIADRQS